ncbi:MAG: hypothetical protein WDO17_19050 [Alphaproteobacteria bacterium]
MNPRDQGPIASRRAVAERLRRFFAELTTQLAAGSADIWERVQRGLTDKATQGGEAAPSPPGGGAETQQMPQRQREPPDQKDRDKR